MDKNTNSTNTVVTTVTRAAAGAGKGPAGAPAAPAAPAPGGMPNPAVLARRVFGNWPIIVIAAIIGVPVSLKVSKSKKPIFKSEGTIVFRGGINGDPSMEAMKMFGNRIKESSVATSTLKRVVDDLNLAPQAMETGDYEGPISTLRAQIETKPKGPDTFTITVSGPTADEAQRLTQRLCDVIIDEGMKSRQERAKDSFDFLQSEKKRADDDLEKAEKARTIFMSEHSEFATDDKGGATIRAEQKANANQTKKVAASAANGRRAAGTAGREAPAAGGPAAGPTIDPVLVAARAQARLELASAKKSLADKSISLTEQHPDVRAAAARVGAAETALAQAEASVAAATVSEPAPAPVPVAVMGTDPYDDSAAAKRAAPLAAGGAAAIEKPRPKPQLTENGEPLAVEIEAEWSKINRDAGEAKTRRNQLDTRLFQAEMTANSEVSGYGTQMVMPEPVTRAGAPTGANPKILGVAGMVVSIVLGIVIAAVRGILLDDRLFDASEVEGLGLVPLLGSVPRGKLEKKKKKQSWLGRLRG
jgi:capsular polysaccharide biosynthesis protein